MKANIQEKVYRFFIYFHFYVNCRLHNRVQSACGLHHNYSENIELPSSESNKYEQGSGGWTADMEVGGDGRTGGRAGIEGVNMDKEELDAGGEGGAGDSEEQEEEEEEEEEKHKP